MEDSALRQKSTLNPSCSFPSHRRRPLRSRTYHALIGVLSHCHANSPQLRIQEEIDDGGIESSPVRDKHAPITSIKLNSKSLLVSVPDSQQIDGTFVKETSIGEDKENSGGFDANQATSPTLDHVNLLSGGGPEVAPANSIGIVDLLVIENQKIDCGIQVAKVQDNANTVLDIQTADLGKSEDLAVDKGFSVADYSELLDSCFDMDMIIESSKIVNDSVENDTVLEENVLKEAEHELQLKEMELEKLIYSENAGEEIEEGEISGEADPSFDALYEDVASQGEGSRENSDDYFNKKEFICNDEDRGCREHKISDPSVINKVNIDSNAVKVNIRTTVGERQDCHSQTVFHYSHMETQRTGHIAPYSEKQSLSGRNLQEYAPDNQISAAFKEDGNAKSKKRKSGPLTKERKDKKKKMYRLKRAEKNRQLGVKRLKLPPELKPKTVSYCRHYLHGRCHQGEDCKFSHDIVPLTKSKPCTHFARQSCMKGDDCPYDHELSKYPCEKYTTTGFCSRGFSCLFSHEMSANQSLSTTPTASNPTSTCAQHSVPEKGGSSSKASKPEGNFLSPLNDSNSSKHLDKHGIFHGNKTELLTAKIAPRAAGQPPKGISFLSNLNVGCNTIHTAKNPDEMSSERVAPRKPRGINFLSFAQPTPDDSSSKMLSKV